MRYEERDRVGDLVLSNARLLDGRGAKVDRATVRVARGHVADVGPGADVKDGPDLEVRLAAAEWIVAPANLNGPRAPLVMMCVSQR